MTVQERLRHLISILPSDESTVAFTRADLVRMLDGEAETIAALDRDLTVEEVAEKVGRAVSTVRTWLIAGDLRGYKLNGKSWRIPQTALRKYLDAQTTVSVRDQEDQADEDDEDIDISAWRKIPLGG